MAAPALKLVDSATGEVTEGSRGSLMARIEELEGALGDAERDLRRKRKQITLLQRDKERERQTFEQRDLVVRLFEFWQARCHKQRSKLTPDRFDALKRALEWGYSPRQIAFAIAGAAHDPFITKDRSGRDVKHQDLELICRDGKHLESFANRAPKRKPIVSR